MACIGTCTANAVRLGSERCVIQHRHLPRVAGAPGWNGLMVQPMEQVRAGVAPDVQSGRFGA